MEAVDSMTLRPRTTMPGIWYLCPQKCVGGPVSGMKENESLNE